MSTNKLIRLSLGAAGALFWAGCAPLPQPPQEKTEGPAPAENVAVEKLDVAPKPETGGPRHRLEAAIDNVRQRDLLTTNGFWTVFHGILGMGFQTTLRNPDTGERFNALQYICDGNEVRGLNFIPTKYGLDVQLGPMMVGQGHQDQFIAEMGEWGIAPDRKFVVNGKDYTFMDFVRHAQMRASTTRNQELSWALVVLGSYLGTDIAWTNQFGEKLRYDDLVRYELDASVDQAACGGTHRLWGLSWAYYLHLRNGGRKDGIWKEIADKTVKYRDLARKYQNPDGSFSTDFFRGPGNATDKNLRINTSGHTLEWLALALPNSELKKPWVENAASAVSLMILDMQDAAIDGGSMYHAVHGLLLYHARVYGGRSPDYPDVEHLPLPPDGALAKAP